MKTKELAQKFTINAAPLREGSTAQWAQAIKPIYDEFGIVLLRQLIDPSEIKSLQNELSFVINLAHEKLKKKSKIQPNSNGKLDRFDADMLEVCRADRNIGGEIFRVAKKLLSVQRLTVDKRFERIAAALITSRTVAIHPFGTNVRADHPGEDHFLYPWHQDYLYNLGSEDSVTFWSPLVDVDDVNGCLLIAPNSHKSGLFPVNVRDPLNKNKNSAQAFDIANLEDLLKKFPYFSVPMNQGDVVAFHGNLLHSSQANRSEGTRWSLQFRYFNLSAPDAIERGWPGGMAEGFDFTKYHPEVVISN